MGEDVFQAVVRAIEICSSVRCSEKTLRSARPHLIYAAHELDEDQSMFIWLNREYKPLGYVGPNPISIFPFVSYADYPSLCFPKDDFADLLLNVCQHHQNNSIYWFFNDGCPPWHGKGQRDAYVQRLRKFLSATDLIHGLPESAYAGTI